MRKPRVLFVGRTRYLLPLSPSLARKFEALGHELDLRVLAAAAPGSRPGDAIFTLVPSLRPRALDGLSFWLALPVRVARMLRSFRPDAVVCQTAYDAAAALLARRLAAPRVEASLRVIGKGSRADVAEALVREDGVRWDEELTPEEVATALDDAWVLVLPSRSEGMGRVLVEAFCRGRGVVGTRAGSIPNLVADGVSGLLVEPGDPEALAEALVRVLSDRALAERLAGGARAAAAPWLQTPEQYAQRMRELVE